MIDLYNTRTMLKALVQIKAARTFILSTFFNHTETHITETVDIDVQLGKRRLAPFVNPNMAGKVVEKLGYKTFNYKPAYVKPKMVTTAEDILKRGAGESIYSMDGNELAMRANDRMVKELAELDDMITRREEWMAAKAIQTGVVPIKGEGIDAGESVDFLLPSTHKIALSGANLWSAAATAKPLQNLRAWQKLFSKDAGLAPTDVIMGSDALNAFLAANEVSGPTSPLNQRQIDMGKIDPQTLPEGVTYYGRIKDVNLDLWTYDEWFVDQIDSNTDIEGPMIDANRIIMLSRNARFTRHFGAIKDLSALAPYSRFPKSWISEDPSARYVMVQSAPLPAPHQINAIVSATVCA